MARPMRDKRWLILTVTDRICVIRDVRQIAARDL